MNLHKLINNTKGVLHSNSPAILASIGISGAVVTAYLSAKGSFKAAKIIEQETDPEDSPEGIEEQVRAYAPLVWKCYIPAAISGTVTIGAMLASTSMQGRRTAAAVSAYSITEKAFQEYRGKVKTQIGEHQEQVLRDDIARDFVDKHSPKDSEIIITGSGSVLCCDLYTKRYFQSDMETLRKAQNDVNQQIVHELYVTLDEFYDKIILSHTSSSGELGWDDGRLMELEFSTVLTEDGRPCLAFGFNYIKPI